MNSDNVVPKKIMVMNSGDNVAVCLQELAAGEELSLHNEGVEMRLKTVDPIPLGHKIAIAKIEKDRPIIKYGEVIGKALVDIRIGQHVHVHNVTD